MIWKAFWRLQIAKTQLSPCVVGFVESSNDCNNHGGVRNYVAAPVSGVPS